MIPMRKKRAYRKRKLATKRTAGKRKSTARRGVRRPRAAIGGGRVRLSGQYSDSSCTIIRRKNRQVATMQAVSAPSIDLRNEASVITPGPGNQEAVSYPTLDNLTLQRLYAQLPSPGSAAAGYGARRLVVDSVQSEWLATNQTTAPVEVTFYDISLKKDLPQAWEYVQASSTYLISPDPVDYWLEGVNIASNSAPASVDGYGITGGSPYDSQFFKDYFKIDKRTMVMLPQGGSHRHFMTFHPNTLVKEDEVGTVGNHIQVNYGLRRLNRFCMIIAKGLPCFDTLNGAPTTTRATLSVLESTRIKFQFVLDLSSSLVYNNTLSAPPAVNQFIVNVGSGVYEAITGQ